MLSRRYLELDDLNWMTPEYVEAEEFTMTLTGDVRIFGRQHW